MFKIKPNIGLLSAYQRFGVFSISATRILWIWIFVLCLWILFEVRLRMAIAQYTQQPIPNTETKCVTCPPIPTCPPKTITLPCDNSTCPKCPPVPKKFNYDDVECYRFANKNSTPILFFEQLTSSSRQPTIENTIFFTETSCAKNGIANLDPRRLCAIESAANMHPSRDIFVIFVTPMGFPENGSIPILQTLLETYPNIFFRNLYVPYLVADTHVEKWFFTGELFSGPYVNVHLADLLRLLLLFKYGGTYLDADFLCIKSLDVLKPNFVGDEDGNVIGNAVINFNHNGTIHEIVSVILQEFAQKYNKESFPANGPYLLSSVIKRLCGETNHSLLTRERCEILEVHPPQTFFPIKSTEWWKFFARNETKLVLERVKDSIAVHTWNSHRYYLDFKNHPDSAYSVLAKRFCPKTAEIHLKDF